MERPAQAAAADDDAVDDIIRRHGVAREAVIPILQAIQAAFNYLPADAMRRVVERTGIPPAALYEAATFYSQFRLAPAGRHFIKVCVGTACHVKGAGAVYDAFRRRLGLEGSDDTDSEGLFTVQQVACLGCCMLAPAVQIDDITYGFVDPRRVDGVIRDFLASQDRAPAGVHEDPVLPPIGEARICLCTSCRAGGTLAVRDALRREIHALRLPARVRTVGCTGLSSETPLVDIVLSGGAHFRYGSVGPDDARSLLLHHFRPAGPLRRAWAHTGLWIERFLTDEAWDPRTRRLRHEPEPAQPAATLSEAPGQLRIATEHAGDLDPLDADAYAALGGFEALAEVRDRLGPERAIGLVEASGLRGRGGAGYPTGRKWRQVRGAAGAEKVAICNGDEGDPGAFMDRMIMESFPFRVIEGMLIAAHCVGAREGVLYVRAEYPLAVARLREAIGICRARGLLDAPDAGGPLELRVVEGAGAFVCGEETALIASLEGRRGAPSYRPPYPAESGFRGAPTLINNAETLAMVPWIVRHGAEAFAALGTPDSRGTKTFALAGKIRRGGLVEIPMGITLRSVVNGLGGGIAGGASLKAVQVGGPSGSCIPAALCDARVDYEQLAAAGGIMGSGGMVVLDEEDCMVDIARYFMRFTAAESCGKCTFCRIGTRRMLETLDRLCTGKGRAEDVEELGRLGRIVQEGSLCGLGRTAPNPVLSTLRHFRAEYEAHVAGWCPAGKCVDLIAYTVTQACIGCTRCAQHCPVDAIAFRPYLRHEVDASRCIRCDACRQVCPAGAIAVASGGHIVKRARSRLPESA